jgi:hypothetical protein
MTTQEINAGLKIVKLKDQKFKAVGGYYMPKGYVLHHSELGYFAFAGAKCPYSPVGGKQALQSILDTGGFTDFDSALWLKDMEEVTV